MIADVFCSHYSSKSAMVPGQYSPRSSCCFHCHVTLRSQNASDHTLTLRSRQAIQKYIKANNEIGSISDTAYKNHVNRAILKGEETGTFLRPKG
jgi:hypothetical protein